MRSLGFEASIVSMSERTPQSPSWFSPVVSWAVPFGVCGYLVSAAFPYDFTWDIPLAVLAVVALLALVAGRPQPFSRSSPMLPLLSVFLLGSLFSIYWSDDASRSLRFGAFVLPAVVLYLLVAHHFRFPRDCRLLFVTFSWISLGLASMLLWTPWYHKEFISISNTMARAVGSPLLIVANDAILLSVLAPFSAMLLFLRPRSLVGILAGVSLILSVCVAVVYQSRGTFVSLAFALGLSTILFYRNTPLVRKAGWLGLGVFSLGLVVDGLRGFPLANKFIHYFDNFRFIMWENAWNKFLEAPLFGHGPHSLGYQEGTPHFWVPWAHNLFVELLAERGIIGFVSFMFLLGFGLVSAWRTQRSDNQEVRVYGAAALSALAAFSLAGLFELSFIRQWVVLILFTFLGLISHLTFLAPSSKKERTS